MYKIRVMTPYGWLDAEILASKDGIFLVEWVAQDGVSGLKIVDSAGRSEAVSYIGLSTTWLPLIRQWRGTPKGCRVPQVQELLRIRG